MLTQCKYGFESSAGKSLFVKIVELILPSHIEYWWFAYDVHIELSTV